MRPSVRQQPSAIVSHAGPRPAREWGLAFVLVAVTLLVYIPAMSGGFFWDDSIFLLHNPLIKAAGGLRRLWLTTEPADYFPLTSSVLWVEWRLWGDQPAGYHVINVLLHAACAVLIWRVLRRLKVRGAWLAAALFAVHPVAAASAAWITELKNTLSLVLCAGSFLVFLRYEEAADGRSGDSEIGKSGRPEGIKRPEASRACRANLPLSPSPDLRVSHSRTYLLSVLLFLLALLSKPSVVMLPVVMLLCAWWRRGRISRKDLLRSAPYFALSLILGLVTVWFQRQKSIHGWEVRPEDFASRAAAAGWIAWFYLSKLLLPAGQCVLYPRWNVDGGSVRAFMPLMLLAGGMAVLWARRKSWGRGPFFAAACFLAALLPVLGFVNMSIMRFSLAADHLQYLGLIAVAAFAAGVIVRAGDAGTSLRRPVLCAAACCLAVLAVLTWRRAALYGNEIGMWKDNVAKVPASWGAWTNLGKAYSEAHLDGDAMRSLDRAVAVGPAQAECYYNRGVERGNLKKFAEAIGDYDRAIALKADFASAYYNRGWTYAHIHDEARAIQDYTRVISLDPRFGLAYYGRGATYAQGNDLGKAIENYDEELRLDPDYAPAYNDRGAAYDRMGRRDEAVRDYSKAIEKDPAYTMAYYNRAGVYLEAGRLAEALRDYDAAVRLKPDFAMAYSYRAITFYYGKEYDKALADVKRCEAVGGRPDPDFVKALGEATARAK